MMKTIFLLSCVSKKKHGSHPARDLYDSDWFKKARAYVERTENPWFILSAKYGLLRPNTIITKYDQTLNKLKVNERRLWANTVLEEIRKILMPNDRVVFLAGRRYREFLVDEIHRMGVQVEIPMRGMGIGEQLRWLKRKASSHE